jgi:hypothetical protein
MRFPNVINANWIDSLSDPDLQQAERQLRARFTREETAEKKRNGERYDPMRWPAPLTEAWLRWSLVCNETRARGLRMLPTHTA